MNVMTNGQVWRPKLGPGLHGDEPIFAAHQAWPMAGPPSLIDLLMAFSTYAASSTTVREDRMMAIHDMICDGEFEVTKKRVS